jgi:hypothetical protein
MMSNTSTTRFHRTNTTSTNRSTTPPFNRRSYRQPTPSPIRKSDVRYANIAYASKNSEEPFTTTPRTSFTRSTSAPNMVTSSEPRHNDSPESWQDTQLPDECTEIHSDRKQDDPNMSYAEKMDFIAKKYDIPDDFKLSSKEQEGFMAALCGPLASVYKRTGNFNSIMTLIEIMDLEFKSMEKDETIQANLDILQKSTTKPDSDSNEEEDSKPHAKNLSKTHKFEYHSDNSDDSYISSSHKSRSDFEDSDFQEESMKEQKKNVHFSPFAKSVNFTPLSSKSTTHTFRPTYAQVASPSAGNEPPPSSSSSSDSDESSTTRSRRKRRKDRSKERHSKSHSKRSNQTNKHKRIDVSKLSSKLHKTARDHHLKILKSSPVPTRRRQMFNQWREKLTDTFSVHYLTNDIMIKYPTLPLSLNKLISEAIGNLILAYVDHNVRNMLQGINRTDGLGMLHRLKELFASTGATDHADAYSKLMDLQMLPKESITSFLIRFRSALQELANSSDVHLPPTEREQVTWFLTKVQRGCTNMNIRTLVLQYINFLDMSDPSQGPPTSLANIEHSLTRFESTMRSNPSNSSDIICHNCGRRGHMSPDCRQPKNNRNDRPNQSNRQHHANQAEQSHQRRPVQCYKCNGNHPLKDCRKATTEEKKRLYAEKKQQRLSSSSRPRSNPSQRTSQPSTQTDRRSANLANTDTATTHSTSTPNRPDTQPISQQANTAKTISMGTSKPASRNCIRWASFAAICNSTYSLPPALDLSCCTCGNCYSLDIADFPDPSLHPYHCQCHSHEDFRTCQIIENDIPNSHNKNSDSTEPDTFTLSDTPFVSNLRVEHALATSTHHPHQTSILQNSNLQRKCPSQALHTVSHPSPDNQDDPITLIVEWLIDSGASSYMTPYRSDFFDALDDSKAFVEVANGILVPAAGEGSVKIRIMDIVDFSVIDVILHNVLLVPGLNRRLLSVSQWNIDGGHVNFSPEFCHLTIIDSETNENYNLRVAPPFHQQAHNTTALEQVITPNDEPAPDSTPPLLTDEPLRHPHESTTNRFKLPVQSKLLHDRLLHRGLGSLIIARDADLWHDTTLVVDNDPFCWSCRISKAKLRGRGKSDLSDIENLGPGKFLMIDIVPNPSKRGLTSSTYFPNYVLICDIYSRLIVPFGLREKQKSTKGVLSCLRRFAVEFKPEGDFNLSKIIGIRTDAGSEFTSADFIKACTETLNIRLTFAAPRHQEMNGYVERGWQSLRNLAFAAMIHARVGFEFFDFAFEHAWKVYAVLPIHGLLKDGRPSTPHEMYTNTKPALRRFRVLFCPSVASIGRRKELGTKRILHRGNNAERGIAGIFVAIPRDSAGWEIYIPSTGATVISMDVQFDENFESTLAYTRQRFTGAQMTLPPAHPAFFQPEDLEHTGQAGDFADNEDAPGYTADPHHDRDYQKFGRISPFHTVQEGSHDDVDDAFYDAQELEQQHHHHSEHALDKPHPLDLLNEIVDADDHIDFIAEPTLDDSSDSDDSLDSILLPDASPFSTSDESQLRRSGRRPNPITRLGFACRRLPNITDHALLTDIRHVFHVEVNNIDIGGSDPAPYLPEPRFWWELRSLSPSIRKAWLVSMRSELKALLTATTFIKNTPDSTPSSDEFIVPTTVVYKAKLRSDGSVEKLKSRICQRGDLAKANNDWDTWCPIAGFRSLRFFLALAAQWKIRVFQLDFISAFLQSKARNRTFVKMPDAWRDFMPESAEWFGIPLLLNKSLYGGADCGKNFDDDLSDWLIDVFHAERLFSEPSIFIKRDGDDVLILITAVDDQLYASTSVAMRKDFETCLAKRFNVDFLGQVHWYLQSRIQQHEDFSITLDQSRYMAHMMKRTLPTYSLDVISEADRRRFASTLPTGFVASRDDCSTDKVAVESLSEEFGFKYDSVMGMLIWIINSAFALQFPVRKLAKFNAMPGRKHFEALKHLLHHIRCHRFDFGLRYYPTAEESPLYRHFATLQTMGDLGDSPLLLATDASWQDCPDTSRSTGCFLTFFNGGLIDGASFLPVPVALSSAESEYNVFAVAMTGAIHSRQAYNEARGLDPDTPLTIPLLSDSSSALTIASSPRDTKMTRHIARRWHYARQGMLSGAFRGVKVPGKDNPADLGTKNTDGTTNTHLRKLFHVSVPV